MEPPEPSVTLSAAVISDHPARRAFLVRILEDAGLKTRAAASADPLPDAEVIVIDPGCLVDLCGRALGQRGEPEYRALFEHSIDGIFVHGLDGQIVEVNRAAIRQSGYSRDELLRMSVFDLIAGDVPRDPITAQWRSWPAGQSFIVEGSHHRKGADPGPVEINTGKVRFGGKELMLAIVRDITDRKQAEQERERLEEQLRHAQKMEAVGRLAGGVAHDFNNMLTGIIGNAELALAGLPAADPIRESLQAVIASADRAADLTRQLLAFSRRQVNRPRVVDLGPLLLSLEPMLARLLGENIRLTTTIKEQLGPVRVDPVQVEQIVLNLAVNARDAMPDGGDIVLEAMNVTLDEGYCAKHLNAAAGDCVMLVVSDTGTGMDAETRDRIFEPFFTTKGVGEGTGLGLATVYGIVEQSGGRIEVYSEPGRGTSFKIYFPRTSDALEPPDRRTVSVDRQGTETLLVVEDEEMVRNVTVRSLRRLGYNVLVAASASEALQLASRHEGPIDLLLTDVVMPGMNGRELAARITESRPRVRVLYTSGYTENVIAHHGILEDGVQFISKPYSLDGLAARVREMLDRRS